MNWTRFWRHLRFRQAHAWWWKIMIGAILWWMILRGCAHAEDFTMIAKDNGKKHRVYCVGSQKLEIFEDGNNVTFKIKDIPPMRKDASF